MKKKRKKEGKSGKKREKEERSGKKRKKRGKIGKGRKTGKKELVLSSIEYFSSNGLEEGRFTQHF